MMRALRWFWFTAQLIACASGGAQRPVPVSATAPARPVPVSATAPVRPAPRAFQVGDHTLTVFLPSDFPDPALDLTTSPDPSVGKEFWTATSPRGTLIIVVWHLPPSVVLDEPTATQLFDGWRAEVLEEFRVELAWEHVSPVAGRLGREYRTRPGPNAPAMRYRYVVIGDRVLDLRFIANTPENLDESDVVAFFDRSG
jgi:hypothetical protein